MRFVVAESRKKRRSLAVICWALADGASNASTANPVDNRRLNMVSLLLLTPRFIQAMREAEWPPFSLATSQSEVRITTWSLANYISGAFYTASFGQSQAARPLVIDRRQCKRGFG